METLPQVTPADQIKLNEFSTKIIQRDRISSELTKLEFEKEQIDDVSLELEMVMDDKVGYVVNSQDSLIYESFIKLKPEEIISNLEIKNEKLESKIESLKEQLDGLDEEMKDLKRELYAKFGDTINLER